MAIPDGEDGCSISFRQLIVFESIARLNSVQRAAEERHLSQPAASQALAKLEQQVGAALLSRDRKGSYLSAAGQLFHRRVSRMLAQIADALTELGTGFMVADGPAILCRISRSQTRTLTAILDHGSLAQAADAIGLSECTLKRAAAEAENGLRSRLFRRSTAGISLTHTGQSFARKLKLALREIDAGIEEIGALRCRKVQEVTVGAMYFGGSMLLAPAVMAFGMSHPELRVRVVSDTAAVLREKLASGDVDMMVGLLDGEEPSLVKEALMDTPFRVVARRGHPLLRQGRVGLSQLAAHSWIVTTPGSCRRVALERLFEGKCFPHAPIVTCSVPLTRQVLTESDALTLMTTFELSHQGDDLVPVAFEEVPSAPPLGVMLRAGWLPSALDSQFLTAIRTQAR